MGEAKMGWRIEKTSCAPTGALSLMCFGLRAFFAAAKMSQNRVFGGYLWDMYMPGAPDRGALPGSCSSASAFTAGIISSQAGFKDFLDASISFDMQRLIICHNSIKPRLQTLVLLFI